LNIISTIGEISFIAGSQTIITNMISEEAHSHLFFFAHICIADKSKLLTVGRP
jgi:hypothetical protein